jgi:hypothetical protein
MNELDGDFKQRERAFQELAALRDLILEELETAAKRDDNSLETRRNLAKLLETARAAAAPLVSVQRSAREKSGDTRNRHAVV